MWDLTSPWSQLDWGPIRQDEGTCGPICQHPPCWQSRNKALKGIIQKAPPIPPKEEIETDLPTLKVCNMLEDYGEDPLDRYPADNFGQPKHKKKLPSLKNQSRKSSSRGVIMGIKVPSPPTQTPVSATKSKPDPPPKKTAKLVEIQEVFEVEDLHGSWDDAFMPTKYYVWVPNPNRKSLHGQTASISQLAPGSQQKILPKDMTEDMIPREFELEQSLQRTRRRNCVSPVSSWYMRRSPYSKGSSVGPRGLSRPMAVDTSGALETFRTDIDELLDLPRDILVQVLDHAKQSDFASSQKLHELISKFMPTYNKEITSMTNTSTDLLQQKKMNIYQGKERNVREPHLMETKPVYYLDEDGVQQEMLPPNTQDSEARGQRVLDSDYSSFRDLYMSGTREFPKMKKPLPPISGEPGTPKLPSISLGLPELPSGVRQIRPFTYTRRNYRNVDLTIGPVPTPPSTTRSTESPGSDHGTTVHVNVPTDVSQRDPIPSARMENRVENVASAKSDRTPLHAVSPAQSTKVPQAPATTPQTHGNASPVKAYIREQMGAEPKSAPAEFEAVRESTSSPTQEIRAPTNSPRLMSPEPTGLRTIDEHGQEDGDGPHPMSRGGRSVRFAAEVPEVPPPPSSPEVESTDQMDLKLNTPMVLESLENKPVSRQTALTNQPTFNTIDKDMSQDELTNRSSRKRDSSLLSTPEPWPQVNEADYDVTPANTKMTLHDDRTTTDKTKGDESRLAHMDPHSDRTVGTANSSIRSDLNSRDSTRSYLTKMEESPAPPPPSPEPKDINRNAEEPKSARKRDTKSRESTTMTPLMEEHDEEDQTDTHIRTLVIEVPPLGQGKPEKGGKVKRSTDTFINIDIPAQTEEERLQEEINLKLQSMKNAKKLDLEPPVEEETEDDVDQDDCTINTREQNLSVQSSNGDQLTIDQDTETDVMSAGVDPSIGGNVSPTSTITTTDNKYNQVEIRNFIEQQQEEGNETLTEKDEENEPPSSERRGLHSKEEGDQEHPTSIENEKEVALNPNEEAKDEGPDPNEDEKELEITEEGGDHEGFKQELKEEYERMSQNEDLK